MLEGVQFVIISGLSGSGKSYAIRFFEDLGFFCVDNLPPQLLPKFVELCIQSRERVDRVALGVDIRERVFLDTFLNTYDALKEEGYRMELVFLEAEDEVLVRRFSETRRPHPLARDQSVLDGIHLEREKLSNLRERADTIIDTSDFTVHQLKDLIARHYPGHEKGRKLNIFLISFGYKYGIPYDSDLLFDVRFLGNPNFVGELKPLTGQDPPVMEFVFAQPESKVFLEKVADLLNYLIPLYEKEGKSYLTIGIGCTGGRHRSVAVVNQLRESLMKQGHQVRYHHRDLLHT